MHRLFTGFFLIGIAGAILQLLLGDTGAPARVVGALWEAADLAVQVSLGLIGVLALWSGLFRLAEQSRLADRLAALVQPVLHRLMPSVPEGSQAGAGISMNMAANMLGLDNAATPLGLKAMSSLQESNPRPRTASDAQIMFLVLNTSAVTLVPVTVLLYRTQQGAADPADIYLPMLMATTASTFVGVALTARLQGIRLRDPILLAVAGGWLALLGLLGLAVWWVPPDASTRLSSLLGNGLLLAVIGAFFVAAWRARVDSYDAFIEGAKEGFNLAVRLIPYLVAMLAAIAMLRASGVLEAVLSAIRHAALWLGWDTRFVDALPVALLKPLSGSGARAAMLDVMHTQGVDSLAGRMAAVMQGSTETTFYVLAVYFGSVGVRNFRYALWCGLAADAAGLITAILVSYLFFG
ncbi:nucleoside recognition domain-containing protein [Alloalcanivorax xenomutans]|uniref:nucleoside recognition domain-containing protein n=1 Tax=Alloalcanivorax xenomutans TaxID=1094342 RepID=UPI00047E7358|nr:spore maturation protein [Alloalcanivorax xenomutans]WOD30463.1 nucleoside recognition domain-containing protein [Alloalcanivorax xenomutans]